MEPTSNAEPERYDSSPARRVAQGEAVADNGSCYDAHAARSVAALEEIGVTRAVKSGVFDWADAAAAEGHSLGSLRGDTAAKQDKGTPSEPRLSPDLNWYLPTGALGHDAAGGNLQQEEHIEKRHEEQELQQQEAQHSQQERREEQQDEWQEEQEDERQEEQEPQQHEAQDTQQEEQEVQEPGQQEGREEQQEKQHEEQELQQQEAHHLQQERQEEQEDERQEEQEPQQQGAQPSQQEVPDDEPLQRGTQPPKQEMLEENGGEHQEERREEGEPPDVGEASPERRAAPEQCEEVVEQGCAAVLIEQRKLFEAEIESCRRDQEQAAEKFREQEELMRIAVAEAELRAEVEAAKRVAEEHEREAQQLLLEAERQSLQERLREQEEQTRIEMEAQKQELAEIAEESAQARVEEQTIERLEDERERISRAQDLDLLHCEPKRRGRFFWRVVKHLVIVLLGMLLQHFLPLIWAWFASAWLGHDCAVDAIEPDAVDAPLDKDYLNIDWAQHENSDAQRALAVVAAVVGGVVSVASTAKRFFL